MKQLAKFLKPYRWKVLIGMLMKMVETILELCLPLLMAKIIDVGIKQGDTGYICHMALWMFMFITTGFLCAFLGQYYAAVVAQGMGKDMRMDLMEHIAKFSYKELDEFGMSTLMNRLTNDVNQMITAVNMFIRLILRAPFLCIGALALSFYVNFEMSLIFAGLIPIFILILYVISRLTVPRFRQVQQSLDRLGVAIRENLSGVRVIRAFVQQREEKKRVYHAAEDLADRTIKVNNISVLINPLTTIVVNIGIVGILCLGGWQIYNGWMFQGDLVALINYITQILLALILAANLISLFTKAAASSARIQKVRETVPSIQDSEEAEEENQNAKADSLLEFRNVTFSYGGAPTLQNINFTLNAGKMLGIIGTTGSGKSTLIHLIERFYEVKEGEILLCGKDVRNWEQEKLRNQIGLVPQRSVLFSGSVADNLRFSSPDATDEEMDLALKGAQAYTFVHQKSGGLQGQIYEGGKNLSGGQKQRLCIARALIRKPRLLILDDSLSALDASTAQKITKTLQEEYPGMAVMMISQRISAIAGADEILVLEEGKQAGLGTHSQLLNSCDTYREIFESQTQKEAI